MGDRERSGGGVGSVHRGDRPGAGVVGGVDVCGPGTTRATLDAEQAACGDDVPRRIHDGGHGGLSGRNRVPAEEQADRGDVVHDGETSIVSGCEVLRVTGEAGPDGLVAHAGDGVGHGSHTGGIGSAAAGGCPVHIKVHWLAGQRGATGGQRRGELDGLADVAGHVIGDEFGWRSRRRARNLDVVEYYLVPKALRIRRDDYLVNTQEAEGVAPAPEACGDVRRVDRCPRQLADERHSQAARLPGGTDLAADEVEHLTTHRHRRAPAVEDAYVALDRVHIAVVRWRAPIVVRGRPGGVGPCESVLVGEVAVGLVAGVEELEIQNGGASRCDGVGSSTQPNQRRAAEQQRQDRS